MRFVWFLRKLIFSSLLVLGLFLLTGCGQVSSTAPVAPPTLTSMPDLTSVGQWRQIPLPVAGGSLSGYIVSPIDPTTVYACTNDRNSTTQHVVLWRTHEAGQHWSRLAPPASAGNSCSISTNCAKESLVFRRGEELAQTSESIYLKCSVKYRTLVL